MNKKLTTILILTGLVCMSIPVINSASTASIDGSFQPLATLSIKCNRTALNATDIDLGSNYKFVNNTPDDTELTEYGSVNVSNDGDINCSVTVLAINSTGGWTLVDNASCAGGTDVFSVTTDQTDGTYDDLWVPNTLTADIGGDGAGWASNMTAFNVTIWLSGFQSQAQHYQFFFINLTAAVVT